MKTQIKIYCVALAFLGLAITSPSFAQQNTAGKLPIIKIEQDFQGVDVASGTYITKSPFHLNSSAASKLGITTTFNGRAFTHSLNTYFIDQTHTYWGGDYTVRELTVMFEGKSFFFRCHALGDCLDINYPKDGSKLVRLSMRQVLNGVSGEDRYRFTYRDGTVVDFFDPAYEAVPWCWDPDADCNSAWYAATAYASSIKYPSGEKLTFEPFSTQGYDEGGVYRASIGVNSNLGYRLRFSTKMPTSYSPATNAGGLWLRQIVADDEDIKITLQKNATNIIGIQGKRIRETVPTPGTFGTSVVMKTFQETDSIGRVMSWDFETYWGNRCLYIGMNVVATMVTKETSPGGVITNIEYYPDLNKEIALWQVKSVTRSGMKWDYTYNESGRPGITSTDLYGGKRTSLPGYTGSPLSSPGGCDPLIPAGSSKLTDELGRVTNLAIDPSTGLAAEIVYPEGNGYTYQRDARANILAAYQKPKGGGSSVLISQAGYDAVCSNLMACNSPNWSKDAKGAQTDYTYYADHGGLKSVTAPVDNVGIYRRDFYFFEAYDTGDGVIYRQNRSETCGLNSAQLTATSCPANSATNVTLTAYWQKTFLPQTVTLTDGVGSLSATTEYTYNDLGLALSVNGPRTDVDDTSYRTYDGVGRLIFEIGPDPDGIGPMTRQVVKHYYNNDDQEVRTETGTANTIDGSDFAWASAKVMTFNNAAQLIKTAVVVP